MAVIVLLIGVLIAGIGIAILSSPARLRRLLHWFLESKNLYAVAAIRVIAGVLFILAAPETRLPMLIQVLGILFILAGVAIPLLGTERVDRLAGWWLARSDSILRLWALVTIAFGGLIVWCAL